MKPSWEWNEDDIVALIRSEVKESIDLDYKECAALANTDGKKNEISKDVSAFANSAGGTIVYGVKENGHIPIDIDEGYDPTGISKEWLEQIINSRIQRRIDGIRINQVDLFKDRYGKVLYVIHIPQSHHAPHMAADKRYYKRFNFQSVPMEEYEVRDVSMRLESPDLSLSFNISQVTPLIFNPNEQFSVPIEIVPSIINFSPVPAEYSLVTMYFDCTLKALPRDRSLIKHLNNLITINEKKYTLNTLQKKLSIPGTMPIWEGVSFGIIDKPIELSFPEGVGEYLLGWEIRAPRMIPRNNFFILSSNGYSFSVLEAHL